MRSAGFAAVRGALGEEIGIGLLGGALGGTVGGRSTCCALGLPTSDGICGFGPLGGPTGACMPGAFGPGNVLGCCGGGVANGPAGGIIGPGGGMPMPAAGGDAIGPAGASMPAGTCGDETASALPQLRQNFMPGGLSPRQTLHVFGGGNP